MIYQIGMVVSVLVVAVAIPVGFIVCALLVLGLL